MEGRGSRGPGPDRIRSSRLRLTGTRGYPYPQVPTQVTQVCQFLYATGAPQNYCSASQSQNERQPQQREQEKEQHHQHQQQRQQQDILLEGYRELQPQYMRPQTFPLPQPMEYGANQVRFGQVQCFNGYRLPLRDPRERTWSQLEAAYCGSTAAVASLAASPEEAPNRKRPRLGPAPTDPRQALFRGASRQNHPPSMSSGPSTQEPLRHTVTGADVQKEFAVSHAVASSRTPQGHNGSDESPKQELLVHIEKMDEDMAEDDSRVEFLNNKELKLEREASSSADKANDRSNGESGDKVYDKSYDKVSEKVKAKIRAKLNNNLDAALLKLKLASISEAIYSKNNKTARLEHASFDKLGPKLDQPLYRQPSDNSVYHENREKFLAFKRRLMSHIKQKALEEESRQERETKKYNQLMKSWRKEMEDKENTAAYKSENQKQREIFEKQFPELKKQRVSRERSLRAGNRVRSEAHMQEIIDEIQEQENADREMRKNAAVLPVIADFQECRRPRYCDHNRLVRDMAATHNERQQQSTWTDQEKEIFLKKFTEFPKNFGKIASFLEKKSVSECVRYYYLTKKKVNYKQLVGKSKKVQQKTTNRRSRRNSQK